jgi:hypothetical protein
MCRDAPIEGHIHGHWQVPSATETDRWVTLSLLVGVVANLLPFAVFGRALPDLSAGPFDNIWIAQFTAQITSGAPLTVAPDPWFRYVPQVLVLDGVRS